MYYRRVPEIKLPACSEIKIFFANVKSILISEQAGTCLILVVCGIILCIKNISTGSFTRD